MSKYLEFEENGNNVFVFSKRQKSVLGEIVWYPSWNQFVFEPISNAVFNDECLEDIVQKIKVMNEG